MELDDIDVDLLREVQRDAGRPLHELGSVVGLSAPAVQRRLGKLRRAGVIQRTVAIVDRSRVGSPITLLTFATCASDKPDATRSMRQRAIALPEVLQCYELTGATDFVSVFAVPTMDRYKELVDELFGSDPNVTRIRTHVVLDVVKHTHEVPVETGASR